MNTKDMLREAYRQALLGAKAKGMESQKAHLAARKAAANVVSRTTGETISEQMLNEALGPRITGGRRR